MNYLTHCFPRNWRQSESESHCTELAILQIESFVENGLLLTPETIPLPAETRHDDRLRDDAFTIQIRCCFTLLGRDELFGHTAIFGPVGIRIPLSEGRLLGASPVNYVSISDRTSELGRTDADMDQFYVALLHRMYEARSVLDEISKVQREAPKSFVGRRLIGLMDTIDRVVQRLNGNPATVVRVLRSMEDEIDSLEELSAAIRYASQFIYPTEHSNEEKPYGRELHYYMQKEWRIVQGASGSNQIRTREVQPEGELDLLMYLNPEFFSKNVELGLSQLEDAIQVWEASHFISLADSAGIGDVIHDVFIHAEDKRIIHSEIENACETLGLRFELIDR